MVAWRKSAYTSAATPSSSTSSKAEGWPSSSSSVTSNSTTSPDEPAGSSGEVVLLEVTELDEDGQPSAFELVEDEGVAAEVYADFRQATKDLYDFAD